MTSIDSKRLTELHDRIDRDVSTGLLTSCQYAVGLDGEVVVHEAMGDQPIDTRYVLFSATKAFIAGVMWQLFDEGRLDPSSRVTDTLDWFGANGKAEVTIEQLLTHTSGFPYAPMPPALWPDRAARRERIASWRCSWEPGTRFEYHPTSAHWVLAELIAEVDGRDHTESVRSRISEPLGLRRFMLGAAPTATEGTLPAGPAPLTIVGEDPGPDELEAVFGVRSYDRGEVTPEALVASGAPEALAAGLPGGGGISDAADVARYYQALLHDPLGLWNAATREDFAQRIRCTLPDPLLGHASNRSLGLIVAGDDRRSNLRGMGHAVSPRTFGHNGAAGQIVWADPVSGLSFCFLTNTVDRNFLREHRRTSAIASRAAVLTVPR